MAGEMKLLRSDCVSCNGSRMHRVMFEHRITQDDDYRASMVRYTLQCKGCETIGFRVDYEDYESGYYGDDGEWNFPTTTEIFPKMTAGDMDLEVWSVPKVVRKIYEETLLAIQAEAYILAGLGLRSTVEAICNDRDVTGKGLEQKIGKLAGIGYISKKDAERLHGIRFLGNDAAHDIKAPSKGQIAVALKIVEHAINTIYVLEQQAREELEPTISDFPNFVVLLDKILCSEDLKKDEEIALSKILGRSLRRIQDNLNSFEALLLAAIRDGTYKELAIGSVVQVGDPPKPLQLFKILEED